MLSVYFPLRNENMLLNVLRFPVSNGRWHYYEHYVNSMWSINGSYGWQHQGIVVGQETVMVSVHN